MDPDDPPAHDSPAPEPLGHPSRTGRFWFDAAAATSAIVISLTSLYVAFEGERTQRGLLAANSWPFVEISKDQTATEVKLDAENAGVGPARIFTFELSYKGQSVSSAVRLLALCCDLKVQAVSGHHVTFFPGFGFGAVAGNVLRPGEHIVALKILKSTSRQDVLSKFVAAMDDMSFRICYCSVLNECWIADAQSLDQLPVRRCPAPAHPFTFDE